MLSDNAVKILKKRYVIKDEQGNPIETPYDMFMRVATCVSKGDEVLRQDFLDMMVNLNFLPNSPTLMNAGKPNGQLSGCFVLPIEDNTESIFDAIKYAALIHKSGGGTGFSFSKIRPNGSMVNSTGGVASGPISFLKVFNAATECIKQGGVRRGANMGMLRVDHPDILEFIKCKSDHTEITNFNLSVAITKVFMEAVEEKKNYSLINPATGESVDVLDANMVFNLIVEYAHKNGEPGIIFIDKINATNPTPWLGEIESTNPCGEQPLLPFEACNLGSINLANMLKKNVNDRWMKIDYDYLESTVRLAVKFLDNVIDVNCYPLPEIDKMTKSTRKIGLGVMGFADALIMMGLLYNSADAVDEGAIIMKFINKIAKEESHKLAILHGCYPAGKEHSDNIRNAARTTIAPTGTLSIIAGVSSGIEPLFAIAFERDQAEMKMLDVNPLFKKMLAEYKIPLSIALVKEIMDKGSIQHMKEIPQVIRELFVTAHDIEPKWHIRMQSVFQMHTDNAVSKTINLSHDATINDVKQAYMLAYKTHCKGITIYRDGSRDNQVLTTGASYADKKDVESNVTVYGSAKEIADNIISKLNMSEKPTIKLCRDDEVLQVKPRQRPDVTTGFTEKFKIGCGNLYVTVNSDENGICEVFTNTGRGGGCPSQSEATARVVSIALRAGVAPEAIVEQLKGIRCPSTTRQKGLKCTSCPDAIGKIIEQVHKKIAKDVVYDKIETTTIEEASKGVQSFIQGKAYCPECHKEVEHEGGCMVCRNCGFSKCG